MKGITPIREPFGETRYLGYEWDRVSIAANAPEASGVYGLYHGVWIQVGESDNLRAGLLDLLEANDPCIVRYAPSGFAFELVAAPERHRRYLELLKETEPICGSKVGMPRARRSAGVSTAGGQSAPKQTAGSIVSPITLALTTEIGSVKRAR